MKKLSLIKILAILLCFTLLCTIIIHTFINIFYYSQEKTHHIEIPYTKFVDYCNSHMVDSVHLNNQKSEIQFLLKSSIFDFIHNEDKYIFINKTIEDEIKNIEHILYIEKNKNSNSIYNYRGILGDGLTNFIKNNPDCKINFFTTNPKYDNFVYDLLTMNIKVISDDTDSDLSIGAILLQLLPIGVMVIFYIFIFKTINGKGKFGFSEESLIPQTPEQGFEVIGGHWETKKELMDIINLINNRDVDPNKQKYIPKGYLLTGVPGTGKTALARAMAHETDCKFLYVCASDFVRFYVGQGAANVRKMMEVARKNAPCIIFLDEIDSLGRRSGSRDQGHNEGDSTLNTLLTEIDGFKENNDIIFIGATNFEENVDPALLRAGRLERKIHINLPELGEREEILNIYLKDIKICEDINIKFLAEQTAGFSGADLENLVKTAVLQTIVNNVDKVTSEDFDEAFYKIVMNGNKRTRIDPELASKKNIVAYHEAGHALGHWLYNHKVPNKITIIPSTSGAGGVTISAPRENMLYSKRYLKDQIKILYGGRIGEEYFLNNEEEVTVGAQQDIKEATKILMKIVNYYGMNGSLIDYGVIEKKDHNVEQIEKLAKELYLEAKTDIFNNSEYLIRLANRLIEKESLDKSEVEEVFAQPLDITK